MQNRSDRKPDDNLPTSQQADKYEFVVWDYIHACEPGACELASQGICNYAKEGLCGVEEWYINNIFGTLAEFAKKSGDPIVRQWLGFHLMPLYHQLVKLKKLEWAISACGRIEYMNKGGDWRIHPVYRELRQTVQQITLEWKNSGMMDVAKDLGYITNVTPPGIDAMMSRKRRKRGDIHAVEKIEGTYRKNME